MKNYEQMAKDVLRKRDETLAIQARKRHTVRRVGTVAAVCILTVGITAGAWGIGMMNRRQDTPTLPNDPSSSDIRPIPSETRADGVFWDDTRERKDLNITQSESAILWNWEDLTDPERYSQLLYDGRTYYIHYGDWAYHRREGVTNYVGEKLADGEVYGYEEDWSGEESKRHTLPCEIYALTFSADHSVVAVRFEGQETFYRYQCERTYDPPATLGELMETRKLSEVLPLTALYYQDKKGDSSKHSLTSEESDRVWEILAECKDAPLDENYTYYQNKEDVGFSATSEILGIRNLSFKINAEGYITTNIESYGYQYRIGEEAARQVIDYVKEHMDDPLPQARSFTIVGTVTEIGEGYIKVDDSLMMKNPEDGLTFTIITERQELSRVVKHLLQVGNHVMVTYDGFVSKEDPLRIDDATAIDEVYISTDGEVWIPE